MYFKHVLYTHKNNLLGSSKIVFKSNTANEPIKHVRKMVLVRRNITSTKRQNQNEELAQKNIMNNKYIIKIIINLRNKMKQTQNT